MSRQDQKITEQLIDLQTKVAYQDDIIQTLDDIVSQQQKQLDDLQASFAALYKRFSFLSEAAEGAAIIDEKPPHY